MKKEPELANCGQSSLPVKARRTHLCVTSLSQAIGACRWRSEGVTGSLKRAVLGGHTHTAPRVYMAGNKSERERAIAVT